MPSRDEIQKALRTLPPTEFISTYFFDRLPHVFSEDRITCVAWKNALGNAIEIDPACITFVGSSATGVSLNPLKALKPFDDKSDIDVAVVSAYHFTVAWRYLRTQTQRRNQVDQKTRNAWDEHVKRFVFWGTIATDHLLGVFPFGKRWLDALGAMSRRQPTIGRDIRLRIYQDHDSLRAYQMVGVRSARDELLAEGTI
jgi:hypothetical protein